MIVDNCKGKISYGEALTYDIGFLNYLWYKTIRENKAKSKDPKSQKLAEAIEAELQNNEEDIQL